MGPSSGLGHRYDVPPLDGPGHNNVCGILCQVPVLWESISNGHSRLAGDIVPVLRRLSSRSHPGLLLRRIKVETEDWIQWKGQLSLHFGIAR